MISQNRRERGKFSREILIWKEKKSQKISETMLTALIPYQKTKKNMKLMNSLYFELNKIMVTVLYIYTRVNGKEGTKRTN